MGVLCRRRLPTLAWALTFEGTRRQLHAEPCNFDLAQQRPLELHSMHIVHCLGGVCVGFPRQRTETRPGQLLAAVGFGRLTPTSASGPTDVAARIRQRIWYTYCVTGWTAAAGLMHYHRGVGCGPEVDP